MPESGRSIKSKIGKGYVIKGGKLELRDAIRMAVEKPEFAQDLVKNPEKYENIFNFKPEHITALKGIKLEDFADLGKIANPEHFADGVAASEAFMRANIKDIAGMKVAIYD